MKKTLIVKGITNLGKGLGTQIKIHTQKNNPRVIVGHDYRSYSEEIKTALKKGLISTGMSHRRCRIVTYLLWFILPNLI
jgi:phosphomannomutase/phosphoglucomutase